MAEGDEDKTAFLLEREYFAARRCLSSTSEESMLRDIQETFDRLRSINMKLNLKKCSFSVEKGPFLGHLITKQGIKANPLKVKAVTDLEPPRTLNDVQSLNGKLAALSRFLSKGVEKSLSFFKALKSCTDKKTIRWTTDTEEAFQKMKEFMEILPTLTAPIKGEVLILYVAASTESISAVLLAEREKRQVPIYFASRVLQWGELNYHGLIQADFLIETPAAEDNKMEITKSRTIKEGAKLENMWMLYTDGASSSYDSGASLMPVRPEGKEYTYVLRFEFKITNNKAEYEALLAGLRIAEYGNQKPSYLHRLPASSQPSKGSLRSQTTFNKAIFRKYERNLEEL
ncbi:reverse transcriptase domain-containing protein [Tanacetum coccineum]